MKRFFLILAAAAGGLLAQSGISPPRAGYIKDDAGGLRPVYGVAGSFLLGDPIASGVISAAFSGRLGLAKTSGALYAFDREGRLIGQFPAAEGPAQFMFSRGGSEAIVFLPDTSEWVRWRNGEFQLLPIADHGESALSAGLTLADGTLVFAADNELVLRKADGSETRTSLTGPILSIEQMGEGWIHVREAGRHTAVRLAGDRIEVYRLPEAAP
jgi:hypothetical protein